MQETARFLLDMVPITIQEQPQPVAPLVNKNVIADLLDIVPDDIEINDEKKLKCQRIRRY